MIKCMVTLLMSYISFLIHQISFCHRNPNQPDITEDEETLNSKIWALCLILPLQAEIWGRDITSLGCFLIYKMKEMALDCLSGLMDF